MADDEDSGWAGSRELGLTRLGIGLAQGLLLYALYRAADAHVWPATQPVLFAPLALILLFVPLIAIQGAGGMRTRTLLLWCAGATLMLAVLGGYDRWHEWIVEVPKADGLSETIMPSFALFFFGAAGLFIAHCLIGAADRAGKWIAPYDDYFDAAWKLGLQLALAFVFTSVFWGVLWLGASMFDLIGLTFLSRIIDKAWFAIPATALATAASLHLTDVGARLVAGIRSVVLVLLSWLLPLMALLAAGFLVSLLFTGLEPLWQTKRAAALMLAAAAALVFLINAAWQNGPAHHSPPMALRIGGSVASVALLPLVAIAAYALALRVGQHGWSETRIHATACIVVAACYALGYGWAAFKGSVLKAHWLSFVAPVNIATSFVVLGVLIALFSPIADPMRIAVASQTGRLTSGAIAADKFDYRYLRFSGGRFGHEALTDLAANATGPDAKLIRDRAKAALKTPHRYRITKATPHVLTAQLTVYPHDYTLPKSLTAQDWTKETGSRIPPCLRRSGATCEVFPAALTGTPPDQLIFVWGSDRYWQSAVLGQDAKGHWSVVGRLSRPHCKPALEALRKGQYQIVAPAPPRFRDIDTGGGRFTVEPVQPVPRCPQAHD